MLGNWLCIFAVIIVAAFDRVANAEPKANVVNQVAHAYRRCGLSFTLTSLTDIAAFLLGSLSKLPAVQLFWYAHSPFSASYESILTAYMFECVCVHGHSLYAAVSIGFCYVGMCTGFAAMLALDARRQAAHRADCCFCVAMQISATTATDPATVTTRDTGNSVQKSGRLERAMARYAELLLKPHTKAAVLLLFGAMLALNCVGWSKTTSGFNMEDLTPDQSYVRDNIDLNRLFMDHPVGDYHFGIYTKQLEYHTPAVQREYVKFHNALATSDKVARVESWYIDFISFVASNASLAATVSNTRETYYLAIAAFLAYEPVPGVKPYRRWLDDIVWVDDSQPAAGIKAARFRAVHPVNVSKGQAEVVECLEAVEAIQIASALPEQPFCWMFYYLFFDQFRTIYTEMMVNLGLCEEIDKHHAYLRRPSSLNLSMVCECVGQASVLWWQPAFCSSTNSWLCCSLAY
eukprot:SAG31_NODE_4328_length_3351_cov_1.759225_2_plen_461_part_00